MARDIDDWLGRLGLSKYGPVFAAQEVSLADLAELTEADLTEMGLPIGPRRRVLKAIAAGDPEPVATPATAPAATAPAEAERRQLTVMFCDLVGSTVLSQRLDPEDYREVIRVFQETCAGAVRSHGGHVAKHLGDGLLAYFGYPSASEDDAERAVRAGLALVRAVPALPAPETLHARVGVETGLVVIGRMIGEGMAQEGEISGETPNLAARLQQCARPGQVVAGPTIRRVLGGAFELGDLGPQALKGITAPVRPYHVIGEARARSRFEARQAGRLTDFVGRETERETLLRRWEEAKNGEGQVVLISGEPGIGKSRLTHELRARIGGEPQIRLRYQCAPHHTNSALHPVIAQLTFAAGIEPDEPAGSKLDKLEALIRQGDGDVPAVAPLFADLLSITTEGRYPALDFTPQRRREETLAALLDQLAGLAAAKPVLVLYEDVHWVDPTTQELLDLTVERIADLPVLTVITFRPEYAAPWVGTAHVTSLALSRLSKRLSAEIMTSIASGGVLSNAVIADIVARTEGVPLFLEELTKAVLEAGPGAPDGRRASAHQVPATLKDSLAARLDRLGTAREIAQLGAVIGRTFSADLLEAVSDAGDLWDGGNLAAALDRLVDAELVIRRGTGAEARYTFKHALIQDTAYESLLRDRRQALHARVAVVLEQSPATIETQPELLAHHHTAAAQVDEALRYWQSAAERANERSAPNEAAGHAQNGLALLDALSDTQPHMRAELGLRMALANALLVGSGYGSSEVRETYQRAFELSESLGDAGRLFASIIGLCGYHQVHGEFDRSAETSRRGLEIARRDGDDTGKVVSLLCHGMDLWFTGRPQEGLAHAEELHAIYETADRPLPLSLFGQEPGLCGEAVRATLLWLCGHPGSAWAAFERTIAEAHEMGHAYTIAWVTAQAHFAYGYQGGGPDYMREAEAFVRLCDEQRSSMFGVIARFHRGHASALTGGDDRGIDEMVRALGIWRQAGAALVPTFLTWLAGAYAARGLRDEGLAACTDASAVLAQTGEKDAEAQMRQIEGTLMLNGPDPNEDAAERCFMRALDVARIQGARCFELRAAKSLARLWRDQGKNREARALLAPVCDWFTEDFETPDLIDAKDLLSALE